LTNHTQFVRMQQLASVGLFTDRRLGQYADAAVFLRSHRRIVSLLQMIPILSSVINELVEGIKRIDNQLKAAQDARGTDARLTPEETQEVTDWVHEFREIAEACEFNTAEMRTYFVTGALGGGCTLNELAREMTVLGECLGVDSTDKLFLYVTRDEAQYYEQDALFGTAVRDAFPSAASDIKRAGNCLAGDLYTASVFHLMRAAERGMRTLAWDRRVKFKDGAPLEMQGWEDIIRAVEGEVQGIKNWPNRLGLAKSQAHEFYNGALSEFRGFKDAWRNHVMHSRRDYEADEAKGVKTHVQRFLQALAVRLSESKRTPKVWGKKQIV